MELTINPTVVRLAKRTATDIADHNQRHNVTRLSMMRTQRGCKIRKRESQPSMHASNAQHSLPRDCSPSSRYRCHTGGAMISLHITARGKAFVKKNHRVYEIWRQRWRLTGANAAWGRLERREQSYGRCAVGHIANELEVLLPQRCQPLKGNPSPPFGSAILVEEHNTRH